MTPATPPISAAMPRLGRSREGRQRQRRRHGERRWCGRRRCCGERDEVGVEGKGFNQNPFPQGVRPKRRGSGRGRALSSLSRSRVPPAQSPLSRHPGNACRSGPRSGAQQAAEGRQLAGRTDTQTAASATLSTSRWFSRPPRRAQPPTPPMRHRTPRAAARAPRPRRRCGRGRGEGGTPTSAKHAAFSPVVFAHTHRRADAGRAAAARRTGSAATLARRAKAIVCLERVGAGRGAEREAKEEGEVLRPTLARSHSCPHFPPSVRGHAPRARGSHAHTHTHNPHKPCPAFWTATTMTRRALCALSPLTRPNSSSASAPRAATASASSATSGWRRRPPLLATGRAPCAPTVGAPTTATASRVRCRTQRCEWWGRERGGERCGRRQGLVYDAWLVVARARGRDEGAGRGRAHSTPSRRCAPLPFPLR